jgi:hypothetical protein
MYEHFPDPSQEDLFKEAQTGQLEVQVAPTAESNT